MFEKLEGEIMLELGAKLRKQRKRFKLTQQELAEKVGVNRRLIGEIEAGKGTSLLVFVKLLKVFNKTDKLLEILSDSPISAKEMYFKENK